MKDKELSQLIESNMDSIAHMVHIIPTAEILRIAVGHDVILDKPFSQKQYIDLAIQCLAVAKEMERNKPERNGH